MSVNSREEYFEYAELFGKPALFTDSRIDRDTVPEGWYAYDLRGSDYDPGEPVTVEPNVLVNHAGTILTHDPVTFPKEGFKRLNGRLDFAESYSLSLKEFCEVRGLNYPEDNQNFILRPASPDEAGIFYTQQELNVTQEPPIIGTVSFASGETLAYTDPDIFLQVIRDELPYKPTSGFQYEVLTDNPVVRKGVDDILYDLFGEENPRPLSDYGPEPSIPTMNLGGM